MRVAILGAGISGLSCAFRLEQLGFTGDIDIFEEKGGIGVGNVYGEFISEMFHRPIRDILTFFNHRYRLYLQPVQAVYGAVSYGPTKVSQNRGYLGYVITRSSHELALEKQLYQKIKSPVIFNTSMDLAYAKSKYDMVVVATGKLADVPSEIGVRIDRYAHFYHALINGDFDPNMVKFWLNDNYAPKGYGYFLPITNKLGMLALVTPKREFDLNKGWSRFVKEVWGNQLDIHELHEVMDLPLGQPKQFRYGNAIFVGHTAGNLAPAMGYGIHIAILSGIYAADSIVNGKNYEQLMRFYNKEYQWSLAIRNMLEKCNNKQYDMIINSMGSAFGRQLLKSGSLNILGTFGRTLSIFTKQTKYSEYIDAPSSIPEFRGKELFKRRSSSDSDNRR